MHAKLPVGLFKPVYTTAKLAIPEVISFLNEDFVEQAYVSCDVSEMYRIVEMLNDRVPPAVVNNIFWIA